MGSFRAVLSYCNRVIQNTHKATIGSEKQLDFRELIHDSSNEVQRMLQTECSPLNKWQCLHLAQKLKDVAALLESFFEEDRSNSGPLKEIYRIVTVAEDLIRQCCFQPWKQAAISQADNDETFFEVLYDLEWCTTLLQPAASVSNPNRKRGTKFKVQLAKRRTEIRSVNGEAAQKDRDELEVRLKGEIQRGSQISHNDVVLAKYLLARLTDAKVSKGVDAERIRGECFNGGAYGHVYKISWLGKIYAEKVFDFEKEADTEKRKSLRKSFEREGQALQSLRHRNVVQLIDHFSNEKECSLVMEYMSSGDLRSLIDLRKASSKLPEGRLSPPFSLAVAVDILVQMAKGMQYMHAERIAHRDIKARNVLVSLVKHSAFLEAEGYVNVKLADFGMAKVKQEPGSSLSSNSTTTLGAVGTYLWKAPELFDQPDDPSIVDPFAADVYSYGITCSEVVTGFIPFSKAGDVPPVDELEVFVTRIAKMGDRPELPDQEDICPPALAFLISKCWSTDPANRPSAADIVRYLLDFKASLLVHGAEFEHLSWTWNFKPDSIDDDYLSSSESDDEIPPAPPGDVPEPSIKEQGGKSPVSELLLRAKDYVSWLTGGSIGSSTSSLSPGPSTAELTSKDLEITSKDVEITSKDWETKQFPFQKLQAATNKFDVAPENGVIIGEGPFARIFRGSFTGKLKEAAVRELIFAENSDPTKFFENVSVMATIKHPNLINLVGFCENEGHFYLVHEFINAPGTIGTVLLGYNNNPRRDVQWSERYQIAVKVGQALAYLHDRNIIHGHLTTRSIMLEEPDLNPRLFDFGMAFLFPDFKNLDDLGNKYQSFVIEKQQWTAPEHKGAGRRNNIKKAPTSDMYSFGILLLVLASGRRVTDENATETIIDAACKIYNEGDVQTFVDPHLTVGSVASERMMLIMQVALLCLQEDPQQRPKASEAVQMLLGEVSIAADRLLNITDRIKQFD